MADKEQVLNKIKQVIAAAEQFKDEQFRLVLEGLLKRGGRDGEFLIIKYMSSSNIPIETKLNIIRSAGYAQSSNFLVPLKKVIDQEASIHLKKAAIITLAKYNNQRALNILNQALQTIKNPYLQGTINEQISLIKKNNPILSLLPRFLKGDKDIKSYRTVLGILKKILKPSDATIFAGYLKSGEPSISRGAFEVLCSNGDRTIQSELLDFFTKHILESDAVLSEDDVLRVSSNLSIYLDRFPSLIYPHLKILQTMYEKYPQKSIRKVIIAIICHCRAPAALNFVKQVYDDAEKEIKECIIKETTGNENAIDFLFEKYLSGKDLRDKVVKALLNSQKGFDYFAEHFNEFGDESQELIVKSLPLEMKEGMETFIKKLFESGRDSLKKFLMKRVRENYLYSFKEMLFDPARQKEFFEIESEFLPTITKMFPVSAVKKIIDRLATEDLEVGRMETYFKYLQEICRMEPVLNFKDSSIMSLLIIKMINANSTELNYQFLSCLEQIKTFDMATYKNYYESLNFFSVQRGENMMDIERAAIKNARGNFQTIVADLKSIEALEKEIKLTLLKDVPDLLHLRKVIVSYHIGAAFKIKPLIKFIAEYFNTIDKKQIPNWREFFNEFPLIAQLVKEARGANLKSRSEETEWSKYKPRSDSFFDKVKIVVRFEEKDVIAIFRDQFGEILPEIKLCFDDLPLEPTDILLCDSAALKEYIAQGKLNTKRIFVLLENRSEFANFKSLNPRAFFRPFSLYRVLKLVLQELYLLRS